MSIGDPRLQTVRSHTHTEYNAGAPSGDEYAGMALPTSVTTGAKIVDGTFDKPDHDLKTTTYGYGAPLGGVSGWKLRTATSTSVGMGGGKDPIVTQSEYNDAGNAVRAVQPDSDGHDAGTTLVAYYDAATNAGCPGSDTEARAEWDGLVCSSGPAAQPSSGPAMPTTQTLSYTARLQPVTSRDVSGGVSRTSVNAYAEDVNLCETVSVLC